jgi:hypothetical protein
MSVKELLMCELCDTQPDGLNPCHLCGKPICFDIDAEDDIFAPAMIDGSGNAVCKRCGLKTQLAEEHDEPGEEHASEILGENGP